MIFALHLGAHKTATTHLQEALRLNAAALRAEGVLAPGLGEVRREATSRLPGSPDAIAAWLDRLISAGAARVAISDENLAGRIAALLRGGRLYPGLERRLAPFASRAERVEVFFTLRSYEGFWPSIWLESLRHRGWREWEDFAAPIDGERARWPRLVARLVRLFGEERVTIWDYAGYRGEWEARLSRLCGGAALAVAPPPDVRPSLSAEAVAMLARDAATLAPPALARRARELARTHPVSPGRPAFASYPPEEAVRLAALYQADLAAIRARFPRLGR